MNRSLRIVAAFACVILTTLILASPALAAPLQPAFDQSSSPLGFAGYTRAWGVAVANFTSQTDSTPDFITANTYGQVSVFKGNGDGTFTPLGQKIWLLTNTGYGLVAGDFNGDGNQDFAISSTVAYTWTVPVFSIVDGGIYLYLGNGDGTFQYTALTSPAPRQGGLFVGDAGTDVVTMAATDADGDGDLDIVAGDIVSTSDNSRADVVLFRNTGNNGSGQPIWDAGTSIISAQNLATPNPEAPPYYPPTTTMQGYGLAFGDVDGDGDEDLLVTDRAAYLYVYANDGHGSFAPVRYERISTGTRPFAFAQLHNLFDVLAIAAGDLNGDGRVDLATGGSGGAWEGKVDLWLNEGVDSASRATFAAAGIIGGAGTDARGLAVGQLNPSVDSFADLLFGNGEGNLYGLFADLADADGDALVDRYDLLDFIPSFPRIDYNGDGGINRLDQVDLDGDGVGSVWEGDADSGALLGDDDADGDGVLNDDDNLPFIANPAQTDADKDGIGEVAGTGPLYSLGDPLDNRDPDADGVPNGPFDPSWQATFSAAKQLLMTGDTPIILRIDALGRWWQAEFTQTLADSVYLDAGAFAAKYPLNWSGTFGEGVTPPAALEGGKELPVTLFLIPKLVWTDSTVVAYLNDRLSFAGFELGQHGTYHAPIQPAGEPSSEMNGYDPLEMFVYMKVGQDTMLGNYDTTGGVPDYLSAVSGNPAISWTGAAEPLFSFAPPYDEFDRSGALATAQLGYGAFSSDVWVEGEPRTLMPDYSDKFDPYGALHAAAVFMPYASDGTYYPGGYATYADYISDHITAGQANVILIEEVNFSGVDSGGAVNNTINPARWAEFQTLLDVVKAYPDAVPMTVGQYAMARSYDNAPDLYNPDQTDDNHNGIGDVAETTITAEAAGVVGGQSTTLRARLTNLVGDPLAGKTLAFIVDENLDGVYDDAVEPHGTALTGADGWAELALTITLAADATTAYQVRFAGDDPYPATSSIGQVTSRHPTAIVANDNATKATRPDGSRGKGAFIATLTDYALGVPLPGMTVVFLIDLDRDGAIEDSEIVATAVTGADGVAWTPLPSAAGRYRVYTARFSGTTGYFPSSDEGTITSAVK